MSDPNLGLLDLVVGDSPRRRRSRSPDEVDVGALVSSACCFPLGLCDPDEAYEVEGFPSVASAEGLYKFLVELVTEARIV